MTAVTRRDALGGILAASLVLPAAAKGSVPAGVRAGDCRVLPYPVLVTPL